MLKTQDTAVHLSGCVSLRKCFVMNLRHVFFFCFLFCFVSAMVKELSDGADHAHTSCYFYTFTAHPHARGARRHF